MVDAENYLLICQRYIELNPVRAGMVESPSEYKWSSFNANGWAQPSKLWTPHQVYCALRNTMDKCALSYREIFKEQTDMALLGEIRQSVNKGLALGNERFKQEIERLSGRRVTSLKRGPKSKSSIMDEFLL